MPRETKIATKKVYESDNYDDDDDDGDDDDDEEEEEENVGDKKSHFHFSFEASLHSLAALR